MVLNDNSIELVAQASRALGNRTPDDVAADESYWRDIQNAFTLDRSLINLNNGNSCPSPTVVHEAYKRYLDYSNQAPVYHRGLIERNIEVVRRRLAAQFGCDAEEMAITRNSSESLQIAQNGIDLEPGDEVVTTEQDYGRMLTTWDQRARRNKITIKKVNFPVPTTGENLYGILEGAITPRTKVLHFCHITNLTGQIFPVQNLARMARSRGIITIVDGAHAAAHFPFKLRDLEMDYYGTSLHKWLLAPTGTGFLYVRRDRIAKTWPMQAAPERSDNDIRKFEEIGTSPAATKAAINEALAFHQAIGTDRVAARLRYLTLRWANKLKTQPARASSTPASIRSTASRASASRTFRRHGSTRSCGTSTASSPPRSPGRNTTASASRRTSTRRSKRSTRSPRRWRICSRTDCRRPPDREAADAGTSRRRRGIQRLRGVEPFGPFLDLLASPELMTRVSALGDYLRYRSALPPRLSELAILVTAAHAGISCLSGTSTRRLRSLPASRRKRSTRCGPHIPPPDLENDEQVVYDLCNALHKDQTSGRTLRARAHEVIGEQATIDAIAICGYYALLAMILNSRHAPIPDPGSLISTAELVDPGRSRSTCS